MSTEQITNYFFNTKLNNLKNAIVENLSYVAVGIL